ncbi:menaquinone-dependent protoporphyrinogen oxidase [Streptomyces sp. SAI-208]|jgi:menaquinone-dependent protoporphyrinogen oxidase|uniref:flavodoxin domain-containing protein n=1 Tax=unclassified Streptomyces TaxID=2593676 RepID=UPI0024770930|nr:MULTISPECIES: flavodoxin domain-containing protein [unclassified Streptomyces]MDH6514795.1 menaquinone-dependent protoporphyrinogen oxidase [Streptomyces sp. SAI-090]MDH6546976.1 menaquinone-dependent protoporphyrinogen oxidase [Streptomyces sp. SAI-041]MDH6566088.1 menaquinone-dependent protoporphyrinogen oxidase [Streptomyces sp. SAI-117]MDH6589003.1 menaquinone-dependent protoporphyrinogen oxidase [Streptomyces sp. SAI-133]MDH6605642.1 menaquinone-dependent protoporphyrinogen oxidase [St
MTTDVLVVYGTTNGSTAQIAETVAEVLNKEGLTASVRPAASVDDLSPYDAVVVGGALYAGHWHRDARRFLRRHRRALADRPLWLFSSGPLDASASERDIPPVPAVGRAMTRLGARGHVTFGGCLEEGAKGWVAGMILRNGKGGDFRDFTAIEQWAAQVAQDLAGVRKD